MLTIPDYVKRPGEGVKACIVEPWHSEEPGDLNTASFNTRPENQYHGDLDRATVRDIATFSEVIAAGQYPWDVEDSNVDVINLSLADPPEGGPIWLDETYRAFIGRWLNKGKIVVAPLGNINMNADKVLEHCDSRLITVGSVDWGPATDALFRMDVSASAHVYDYTYSRPRTGTSFAAPQITGLVCVLLSLIRKQGRETTPDLMRRLLRNTRHLATTHGPSEGTVNVEKALSEVVGYDWRFDHDGDWKTGFGDFLELAGSVWNTSLQKAVKKAEG